MPARRGSFGCRLSSWLCSPRHCGASQSSDLRPMRVMSRFLSLDWLLVIPPPCGESTGASRSGGGLSRLKVPPSRVRGELLWRADGDPRVKPEDRLASCVAAFRAYDHLPRADFLGATDPNRRTTSAASTCTLNSVLALPSAKEIMADFGDTRAGVVVRTHQRRHLAAVHGEDRPLSIPEPINPA